MIKIPLSYVTFDGKETTKDFYFNLTKADLAKINLSIPGGFEELLKKIQDEPTWEDIDTVFEKIILTSYGKRSTTGAFLKSKEYTEEFCASDAYSELFLKWLQNEDNFINKFLEGALNVSMAEAQKILNQQQVGEATEF